MDIRTTGRNLAVDAAKGIGILLVVFAHINYTTGPLIYIYAFHMPLFFIFSGMLFRQDKFETFGAFLKSRFYSLICPYLFFYFAAFLIKVLTAVLADGLSSVFSATFLKSFVQMFLAWGPTVEFANNPLWFVPCLFCVELMYFFIAKTKRWVNILLCTILVVAGWLMKSKYLSMRSLRLLWNWDISFFVIGFYALGNLLSQKTLQLLARCETHRHRHLLCIGAALLCAVVLVPLARFNGKVSVGSGLFKNGFLLYATGLIGTLGVLLAAAAFQHCRFLSYLGKNTFAIMGTHYVIRNMFNAFCSVVGLPIYDSKSIAQSILPFILILTASLLCTAVYNRIWAALPFFRKK